MKPTKTQVKQLFNLNISKSELNDKIKFLKCTNITKDTIFIEVQDNSSIIFNEIRDFHLLYFVVNSKKSIMTCKTKYFVSSYNFLIREGELKGKEIA